MNRYLNIVRSLTNKNMAERFALEKGSRSSRAAKQFVESFI